MLWAPPEVSPLTRALYQNPLFARRIPETDQPPRIALTERLVKDGVRITAVEFAMWRTSSPTPAQLPRSYLRLFGSLNAPSPGAEFRKLFAWSPMQWDQV